MHGRAIFTRYLCCSWIRLVSWYVSIQAHVLTLRSSDAESNELAKIREGRYDEAKSAVFSASLTSHQLPSRVPPLATLERACSVSSLFLASLDTHIYPPFQILQSTSISCLFCSASISAFCWKWSRQGISARVYQIVWRIWIDIVAKLIVLRLEITVLGSMSAQFTLCENMEETGKEYGWLTCCGSVKSHVWSVL